MAHIRRDTAEVLAPKFVATETVPYDNDDNRHGPTSICEDFAVDFRSAPLGGR